MTQPELFVCPIAEGLVVRCTPPAQRDALASLDCLTVAIQRPSPNNQGSQQVIEDGGSQITFSALGQQAPLQEKKVWDPDFVKPKKMKAWLDELIPDFSVHLGGTTSVDITLPEVDKAYGIAKLAETLGIAREDMIFVGDALFPGGNGSPQQKRDSSASRSRIRTRRSS